MKKRILPNSATNQWVNLFGLLFSLVILGVCLYIRVPLLYLVCACAVAYIAPILIYEYLTHKKEILAKPKHAIVWQDVLYKLLGLYVTLAMVLFCYWLFPEYQKNLYQTYWDFLAIIAVIIILITPPYFIFMQRIHPEPDAYWLIGKIVCLDKAHALRKIKQPQFILTQHILGWLVKGFFTPVMFVFMYPNIVLLKTMDITQWQSTPTFFIALTTLLFTIDLFIGLIGYLCTFKLFNTHIRSVDGTLYGWVVCLLCYQPFNASILAHYLTWIEEQTKWIDWVHYKVLVAVWFVICLFFLVIYVLSTVAFGLRFSNLTHRGIITNGPYRYTKHPAYVAKNIFWWLTNVPFAYISMQPDISLKAILFTGGISFIYYLRAKTEEAHLSQDPVYVEYALWMNEHGIFAQLAKKLPFLKYKH